MSNPGVIKLVSLGSVGSTIKRLDIEDNVGESIHIHINQLRLDFSVREFLAFSEQLMECFDRMSLLGGHSYAVFDPFFLFRMRGLISSIKKIEIDRVPLAHLKALHRLNLKRLGEVVVPVPLQRTLVYRYLSGESSAFLDYHQDAYPLVDNESRILRLVESFRLHGYPHKGQYLVLFGEQDYIRDGQHRASILAHELGVHSEVPVMRCHFATRAYRLSPYSDLFTAIPKLIIMRGSRLGYSLLKKVYRRLFRL